MTFGKTLRTLLKMLIPVCFVALCGAILFVTVAGMTDRADALQATTDAIEQPTVDVWLGQPLPPPPEILIERTLYRAGAADGAFTCDAPTTDAVELIDDAGWGCYSITNTGASPVSTFTLFDPAMRPAHVLMPPVTNDGAAGWVEPGETLTHQVEISPTTAAFVTSGDAIQTSYASHQALWSSLDIDDYEIDFAPSCYCYYTQGSPPPYRITVVDGVIANAVSIETGNPAPFWAAITIDEMHDRIAESLDPVSPAWQTTGMLDIEFGLPLSWFIDDAGNVADEEFGGIISNFTQLAHEMPTGDVDCNGETNIIDALMIALYDVELATDAGTCPTLGAPNLADGIHTDDGDVNNDGVTNIVDALIIARCSTGLESMYCPNMALPEL